MTAAVTAVLLQENGADAIAAAADVAVALIAEAATVLFILNNFLFPLLALLLFAEFSSVLQ